MKVWSRYRPDFFFIQDISQPRIGHFADRQLEYPFFLIQIYILAFIRQRLKTGIYDMFPISSQHILSHFQSSEMRIINL